MQRLREANDEASTLLLGSRPFDQSMSKYGLLISSRMALYSGVWKNSSRSFLFGKARVTSPSTGLKRALDRSAQLAADTASASACLRTFLAFLICQTSPLFGSTKTTTKSVYVTRIDSCPNSEAHSLAIVSSRFASCLEDNGDFQRVFDTLLTCGCHLVSTIDRSFHRVTIKS